MRDHSVHVHQVDKKSGSRIRYEKVAEKTGKQVDSDQVELGYELDKGKLVVVDPGGLEPALEKMAAQLSAGDDDDDDGASGRRRKGGSSGGQAPAGRAKKAPAKKSQARSAPASKRRSGSSKTSRGSRSAA